MKSRNVYNEKKEIVAAVEDLAGPLVESEGMVLIAVECSGKSNRKTLRVVIDKDGGITLDDCATVSGQLGDLLEAKMDIGGPYNMEVSSPGLDCPLTKKTHFDYFAGRHVVVKTRFPVQGKLVLQGMLRGISEGVVALDMADQCIGVPYTDILEARLDHQ
jgi:ribosome maturation factor RimP